MNIHARGWTKKDLHGLGTGDDSANKALEERFQKDKAMMKLLFLSLFQNLDATDYQGSLVGNHMIDVTYTVINTDLTMICTYGNLNTTDAARSEPDLAFAMFSSFDR